MKEAVDGFNVFKSSKKSASGVSEEVDKEEDGPTKAKKELYRQMEVINFYFVLF